MAGRLIRLLALLLLGVPIIAGCSSTGTGSSSTGSPSTTTTTDGDETADTSLTIDLVDSGSTTTWHLTCDPVGGDHPDPDRACAVLRDHGAQALPPVATDQICAQIHGGDQTARIHGSWQGNPVDVTFTRIDSCEITRWDALVGLLPAGSG